MIDWNDVDAAEFPLPTSPEDDMRPREFSSRVRIDVAALSHRGKVRKSNEDHYLVTRVGRHIDTLLTNLPEGDVPGRFDETAYAMMVADGMGGMAGGDVASRMAISTLVNVIIHVPDWILRLDEKHAQEVMRRAATYYRKVHDALVERARTDLRLQGMGTTMTTAYSVADNLFIAHVGDSRAYLFRDGALQLLTRDQTQAQLLADVGIIHQEEVARHRLRHVLTHALGGSKELKAEIQRLKLCDWDWLLLCSDGLTDMVDDEAIVEVLREEEKSDAACQALLNRALEAGGKDNITVVLSRYTIPGV